MLGGRCLWDGSRATEGVSEAACRSREGWRAAAGVEVQLLVWVHLASVCGAWGVE